jgi:hypothetical protein
MNNTLLDIIKITLQIIVAAMIGIEVSMPPNPYKEELIIALVMLACLQHDIPNKIINKVNIALNKAWN